MIKRITIIGSTGSIGRNTLRVVEHLRDRFSVFALSGNQNAALLAEQTAAFRPQVIAMTDESRIGDFRAECEKRGTPVPELVSGEQGLRQIASASETDIVVSAAVGAAGLVPTWAAVSAGKTVALANKEAMVLAGELLSGEARRSGSRIIPVDSEHSAIDQCLRSGARDEVRRLILTASGGPFRDTPSHKMALATPEEALNHPTWNMGRRITIDSATLMNKGLEVIEARWLFDVAPARIDVMVHPQSIVHSMVEFADGSILAQMGATDMRQPIQYALTFPERLESCVPPLDWQSLSRLDFMPPDSAKFPCLGLAYRAIEMGGVAPTILNAADEVAVEAFLSKKIGFMDIPKLIEGVLDASETRSQPSLEEILAADSWARQFTLARVSHARIGAI